MKLQYCVVTKSIIMKKIFLLATVAFISAGAFAQKITADKVPATVKKALQKQFPAVTHVKWEKENEDYEASFDSNQQHYSLLINSAGNVIETELEIKIKDLPSGIKGYIQQHYPGEKIKEAARITDQAGQVKYEAEVKGKDLIFDAEGNFIKEIKG